MNTYLYRLLYALWYTVSLLPLGVLYVFSDIASVLVWAVGYRRKVVRSNLSSSFPEKSPQELRRLERAFYRYLCDYFVETLKLTSMGEEELRRRMVFTGTDDLLRILNSGRSCAVYLGHYGNWEWMTSLPFWMPSHVLCGQIYHPLENKVTDRLFLKIRQSRGAKCIAMNDTLREVIQLRQQQQVSCIGYLSDQCPHWVNIHHWLDFFHHDTPVLTGTERIARKADHAVLYGDVRRLRRGYYVCDMLLLAEYPADMREWEITDRYFEELEKTIRRAPQYYLWSHNRWKRTREKFNQRFIYRAGKVIARTPSATNQPSPTHEDSL